MKVQVFFKIPDDGIGKAISWFSRLKTGNSSSCHCGWVIEGNAYEALVFGGVTKRNFDLAYKDVEVDIFEVLPAAMNLCERRRLVIFLESLLGSSKGIYGLAKIPLQAIDAILSFLARRPVFFATRIDVSKHFICSGLVGYGIYKYGTVEATMLFKRWREKSPDDIKDIMERNDVFFKRG